MLNIAVRAARRAGTLINRALNRLGDIHVDTKGHQDYVTEIDREAEATIIQTLLDAYPDHAIIAEESGEHGSSDYQWVIDPLDGTTNFLHSYPQFAVSIALKVRGELDQAVIFDPMRDELYTASRGRGALAPRAWIWHLLPAVASTVFGNSASANGISRPVRYWCAKPAAW